MRIFKTIDSFAEAASNNRLIYSIRRGLMYMMPLVLIGSIFLMLLNLPIPAWQHLMRTLFGSAWESLALSMYNGTLQVMALTALVSISYADAASHALVESGKLNVIRPVLTAFASYVAFTWDDTVISNATAGSNGMFGAIVIAITATRLHLWFHGAVRRVLPKRMRLSTTNTSDTQLLHALRAFPSSLFTVGTFALVRTLVRLLGITDAFAGAYQSLTMQMGQSGGNLPEALLFIATTHLMWFVGLHGTNILDGFAGDVFGAASQTNIALAAAGNAPTEIVTKEFFDAFVHMGGAGATLGLMLALIIAGRNSNANRVAKYSLLPGLFNINEMMVYGLPIIFNPYYLIPFLLAPLLLCLTSYFACWSGLVPYTVAAVEWTTPIGISGYISTGGSMRGVALQVVNLAVSVLVYLPFIRLWELRQSRASERTYQLMTQRLDAKQEVLLNAVINRADEMGTLARTLAFELEQQLDGKSDVGLYLIYQPKVDAEGRAVGAEALLRWNHPHFGAVPPPVTLELAEEAGLTIELGRWVLRTALLDQKRVEKAGYPTIHFSVNVSPSQLRGDDDLVEKVRESLGQAGLAPSHVELELTEQAAIDQSEATREKLVGLRELGVTISIDDFGMGHSSLLYLRDCFATRVKLDRSLVDDIETNVQNQEIVKSITSLCRQLSLGCLAEGVERTGQMEKLRELDCHFYQGYLFGRGMPFEEFIEFLQAHGVSQRDIITCAEREEAPL